MLKNFQNAEVIKQQIISQEYEYFIAFAKNNSTQLAVGYCSVKWGAKEQSIFLSKLYISAQYRKMGFSKKLLNTVFSKYPIYKYIYLTVNKYNTQSINAYKASGFQITDSVVNDIGGGFVMDDYVMTKYNC